MCNHAYWNLSGDFKVKTIRTHRLQLNCDKYLDMDNEQIPTGEIKSVEGTPFDFTDPKKAPLLINAMDRLDGAIVDGTKFGINHAFVVNSDDSEEGTLRECATLMHHSTGREMKVSTTQNCV